MKPIDFQARRQSVAAKMKESGCDVYLATRQASLHYMCGVFVCWRGIAMLTAQGDFHMFYWANDAERLRREGAPMQVTPFTGADLTAKLQAQLAEFGVTGGRIAVDIGPRGNAQPAPGTMTAAEYMEFSEAFPSFTLEDATPIIDDILLIKDEAELERMRKVSQIADYGFRQGLAAIRTGMTENQLAGAVEKAIRDLGSYWTWSVTAGTEAGFGMRTAFHEGVTQVSTEQRLMPNQFIILDFHPSYDLYLCDFSVPIFYGTPNAAQQKLIDCWEEAVDTVFTAIKPGAVIGEVVKKGIAVYEKFGLYEHCIPRFGHGLGLCVRTGPMLNAANTATFRPGMTFAMGAHLYQEGVGGMRLEYPVMVDEQGARQIADTPMKVHIVPIRD